MHYKKNPHEDDFMNDILDLLDDTKPPRRIGAAAAQEEEKKEDDFTFWIFRFPIADFFNYH